MARFVKVSDPARRARIRDNFIRFNAEALDVPVAWKLVAYLSIGYPIEEHDDPELDRAGWQKRVDVATFILER